MNENDYKTERFRLNESTKQNLIDLAGWAEREALPFLWAELAGILGTKNRRAAPLQNHDAIRQGLRTTYAESG